MKISTNDRMVVFYSLWFGQVVFSIDVVYEKKFFIPSGVGRTRYMY